MDNNKADASSSAAYTEFRPAAGYRDLVGAVGNFAPAVGIAAIAIYYRGIIASLLNQGIYSSPSSFLFWFYICFILLFVLVGTWGIYRGVQQLRGVKVYQLDGQQIAIPHAVGRTLIPYSKINACSVDELRSHTHVSKHRDSKGNTHTTRTTHYTDSAGEEVETDAGLLKGNAPYTSHNGGRCLLLVLKDKKKLVLTPDDPERMAEAISAKIGQASLQGP